MKEKLSNSDLISMLNIFHPLERSISEERAQYTSHFLNAILLVLGGGIAIITAMQNNWYKFVFLILCGFLVCILSFLMFRINKRTYRTQLEVIAKCGKIEDLLSFSNSEYYGGNEYWQNEGLMTYKHLKDRKKSESKHEFVIQNIKKGQLRLLFVLSIVFILFGLMFSLYGFIELLRIPEKIINIQAIIITIKMET